MYCISISHKKAPAQIREQFALTIEERTKLRELLKHNEDVEAIVILCTCNRSELYFSKTKDRDGELNVLERVIQAFAKFRNVDPVTFRTYLNLYVNDMAVNHLFQVCAGFDSKILGEDEILRQIKVAFEESARDSMLNYELNILFQKAIACAKKIKTDTLLSNVPISISTLVANDVFHQNTKGRKNVLLCGITGKIGSAIAKNILAKEEVNLIATVRSSHNTAELSNIKGNITYIPFELRYDYVNDADVIISATSSPHLVFSKCQMEEVITTQKTRLLIDLAIPRDLDPSLEQLPDITLKNIDFYDNLSEINGEHKLEELECAKLIMEEEIEVAKKELLFHDCHHKIKEWKEFLEENPLEKILYSMKKNLDYESMEKVLMAFHHAREWVSSE